MPKYIIQKTSITDEDKMKDLLSYTNPVDGCMEWKGSKATDGYPTLHGNRKVHRIIASIKFKQNLEGIIVRHTCDNIKCINPEHLLLGTPLDNARDRNERNRTFRKMNGSIVKRVKELLATNKLEKKEIAMIVGIDPRRVSDISLNVYTDDGKLTKYHQ